MIGDILLHYRIVERLGAGGMGEVYRARDEKLDREVALKVLPEGALADEAARGRFRKEAHALSRLSHPHVATLHDFDSEGGVDFLVMELVAGPSLEEALRGGPLPEKDVVRLGSQLARGLQAAHDQGIVHRDLKPSNLRLTADGLLKIVDFGLARLLAPRATSPGHSTATETAAGTVVGSPPYMAPEQLLGKPPDARTDLYSAGAVLYELATGERPFGGRSGVALTDAILHEEPRPACEVNGRISPGLEAVILKALDKDPELRYQSAKELLVDLERLQVRSGSRSASAAVAGARLLDPADAQRGVAGVSGGRSGEIGSKAQGPIARVEAGRPPRGRERAAWTTLALVLGGLAALFAWRSLTRSAEPRPTVRFRLDVPEELSLYSAALAVSPAGRHVALAPWGLISGRLWIWSLDEPDPRQVPGTEGAWAPFWSPDGASIAFFVAEPPEMALRRIDLATGAVQTIGTVRASLSSGGSWGEEGRIVFSAGDEAGRHRIYSVAAAGGAPSVVLEPDESSEERGHYWPDLLPDGRRFLFAVDSAKGRHRGIWSCSLEPPHERRLVLPGTLRARYSASGHLLYVRDGTLLAQPFDAVRAELTGEAAPVASSLSTPDRWHQGIAGLFSASPAGVLAYVGSTRVDSRLTWFDRRGARLGSVGKPARYDQIQLSPDERRVAAAISGPGESGDLWIYDVERGVAVRVTSDPGVDTDPVWSPDGRDLFFTSERGGRASFRIHRRRLEGHESETLLLDTSENAWPEDVSPDGTALVFLTGGPPTNDTVWALPLNGSGQPKRLLSADYGVDEPQVSPDGRWLAYSADETGEWEVYVERLVRRGERVRVSSAGGRQPRWRGDGRELFYLTPQGRLVAVEVWVGGERLDVVRTSELFDVPLGVSGDAAAVSPVWDQYCATKDGQRFLAITPTEDPRWSLDVVLNWPSLLEE